MSGTTSLSLDCRANALFDTRKNKASWATDAEPHGIKHALLTIQLDALATLVDEQATRRLWKLFTNCAGSIAHGRRLENLSWRCWSRDQSLLRHAQRSQNEHLHVERSLAEEWYGGGGGHHSRPELPHLEAPLDHRTDLTATATIPSASAFELPGPPRSLQGQTRPAPRTSSSTTVTLHSPSDSIQGEQTRTGSGHDDTVLEPTTSCSTNISIAPSPALPRVRTTSSTSTLTSIPPSTTSSRPPLATSSSFSASRSPPVGPLIKRVIFTPPSPRDHAAAALKLLMTSCSEENIRQNDDFNGLDDLPRGEYHTLLPPPSQLTNPQSPQSAAQSQPSSTEPASAVVTSFPTVVILESTPKPTPPDTPARGLSPTSETPRSSFHHQQSLSPLHALAISTTPLSSEQSETLSLKPQQAFSIRPSPENNAPTSESSSLTSSHSPPITGHPGPTAAIENSPSLMMALAPIPAVPAFGRGDKEAPPPPKTAPPHSADSREGGALTSFGPLSLLHPTSATISQESPNSTGMGAMAPLQHQQQSHQAPRMFFLQRDSSSLSPDSNSRSGSHSRSPGGSRSPDGRIAHEAHAHGSSNSPGPRNGESSAGAGLMREASTHRERERSSSIDGEKHHSRVFMSGTGAEKEAMPRYGSLVAASEEPKPKQQVVAVTAAGARESPEHLHQHQQMQQQVDVVNQRPSPPPSEQTNMSVPAASSSSSSHTHPSRPHRLVMRSKKGGYRPHLGRGVERPSSRASTRGSASSNASHHQRGTTGVGSMEANNSAGSMSTSAGSNIVMRRHVRVHSPLRNAPVSENAGDQQLKLQQQLRELSHEKPASATGQLPPALAPASASASGQLQQQQKQEPHVSPLAVLPEPLRMEVLERQVVQSAMKGQGDGRKISLESDSEDDYTDDDDDDDDVDDSEDEIVVQKGKGKVGNTVEAEEDGSSWSDEDDGEEVMIAKKRPQAQQRQAGPSQQNTSRRNSRDLEHLLGSAGSEHHATGDKALPHVKSKSKIHNQRHPPPKHGHVPQRAVSPPPPRQAVNRRTSAGHTRGTSSQDGPLAQAAREALRQRDMFTPLPRERYSSTNLVREKSLTSLSRGGRPSNLTMLLNPDPHWFPQNHPYRQNVAPMDQKLSRSMEELYARGNNGNKGPVKSARPGLGFGGLRMTTTAQPSPQSNATPPVSAAPAPRTAPPAVTTATVAPPAVKPSPPQPSPSKRAPTTSKSPPIAAAPTKLRPSKSALAIPLVLGVTASSTPRDEPHPDMLEMSLRQMGPQRQRAPRQAPVQASSVAKTVATPESKGPPSTRPSSRLPARPADVELSDTDEDAPASSAPKVTASSGRSLAKEHLEAVMGGKPKTGMSASKNVVASPDALPKESRENDPTSYRPPAPPSSPSVYNPYEAKRAQGHLPHTPTPPNKRSPVARAPRIRPHSSHGQPTAPVVSPPAPQATAAPPQRERRQPATSQPPIPVTTAPLQGMGVPWPYNLPYPQPVQSPRTTRLNMLASEVPDDLRKDLLWERKTNRIAPLLDNRTVTPLVPHRRHVSGLKPMTNINNSGGGDDPDEERERARLEREAKERYDKMRTQTWNGVIYQRPLW